MIWCYKNYEKCFLAIPEGIKSIGHEYNASDNDNFLFKMRVTVAALSRKIEFGLINFLNYF